MRKLSPLARSRGEKSHQAFLKYGLGQVPFKIKIFKKQWNHRNERPKEQWPFFENVWCDFSALERAHGLKFRLKAQFLMPNTMTSKFFEYSKILVNLGISSETHQYRSKILKKSRRLYFSHYFDRILIWLTYPYIKHFRLLSLIYKD